MVNRLKQLWKTFCDRFGYFFWGPNASLEVHVRDVADLTSDQVRNSAVEKMLQRIRQASPATDVTVPEGMATSFMLHGRLSKLLRLVRAAKIGDIRLHCIAKTGGTSFPSL